jgi:hypothetical protein
MKSDDGTTTGGLVDGSLIDEALAVVQDARARAPADFLFALATILGAIALALLAAAAVTGGVLQDLLLNLGSEVIGAGLTVVLIDGLWKRMEAGASETLDDMSRKLEARKGSPMTNEERQAWRAFVDDYHEVEGAESPLDRVRGLPAYGRQLRELEARGNRTLDEFRPAPDRGPRAEP